MPRFMIRARETRVHIIYVEAANEDEARELANDMDGSNSVEDSFDQWEVMDVGLDTYAANQQLGEK